MPPPSYNEMGRIQEQRENILTSCPASGRSHMDKGEDDLRTLSIHLRDDPVTFLKGTAPMAWIYLLLAGLMEVVWVFAM
ncbi:MAG: hypothetical protein RLT05_03400, partial [Bauldia litoralis]